MTTFRILCGLTMIAIGTIAVFGGDLWDGWQWILAALAGAAGIGGLTAAFVRREPESDVNSASPA